MSETTLEQSVATATHDRQETAFFDRAIRDLASLGRDGTRVLDFGCGRGAMVELLAELGYDARGCDVPAAGVQRPPERSERLAEIRLAPYRLPFPDASFDVVLSKSVFEHVQNKAEAFREIRRVLRPGGWSLHLYPARWYLPAEPHVFVPLVNFLWPRVPAWWLGLWALLGVRNGFQAGKPWREVARLNREYCATGLSYWSNGAYRRLSAEVFGNGAFEDRFYLEHVDGGFSRLFRRLPLKGLSGRLSRECRMSFLVQRRQD